ncbi:exportin-6 [Ixodes scapularis]|uniref:exportin-6 n=1 Tax=Ixodes scapularis TaxID=6945 RepID=UPI001C390BF4|nr:exportin-6 [Ixodes scapularis]XP_042150339.1 exportin-6 [Ixodes scapularis]
MESGDQCLEALCALLTEFFGDQTTNERKREIEGLLTNFGRQEGCWRQCLHFLVHSTNQYVMMFSLNVLEETIGKRWIRMPAESKAEIRTTLQRFLLAKHREVAAFLRNKLCKLVVDIGRLDWPHFFPDFFSNILQLCQTSETCLLGLVLLKTASEELACPRDDLSVSRKAELRRLLLEQVPAALAVLAGILDSVLEKHRHLVTATPPPSPTHGQSQASLNSSPLQQGNALSSMFESLSKTPLQQCLPPVDGESQALCVQALGCLEHLFSWVPPSRHVSPALLTALFHFSAFGCHPDTSMTTDAGSGQDRSELGVVAMSCINEILSKNCVPSDLEDFLLLVFQNTFYILQILTKHDVVTVGTNTSLVTANNRLGGLNDSYLDKFTEFLRLFVSVHLHRFEENSHCPVLQFLALLFEYTFQQPALERYYACLDIWAVFLEYLVARLNSKLGGGLGDATVRRYKEALATLVAEVLKKSMFKFNQTNLEELDDETLDDNMQTEWQCFLQHNLGIISKVADIIPEDVCAHVLGLFQKDLAVYLELEQFVGPEGLRVTAENECRRLHCCLRDLSSLLQAVGRLASRLTPENFTELLVPTRDTVTRLCHTASYGNRLKFYALKTAAPNVLKSDFIEVQAQSLAALQAFCHWLHQLHSDCLQRTQNAEQFRVLVEAYIEVALPNIVGQSPEKVTHSAAHLLLSLTTVRPSFLLALPAMQQLFGAVCERKLRPLPPESELLVLRSLHNSLCLPWPGVADTGQGWEVRAGHQRRLVAALTSVLVQAACSREFSASTQLQQQAKPSVKWAVRVMRELVEGLEGEGTRAKQLCHGGLGDACNAVVALFPVYLNDREVTEAILDLLLVLFRVLQAQLGAAFAEQMLQTFLSLFTREQLQNCILNEGSVGIRVVEKFLSLLQQIVKEPSAAFKVFVPRIIDLCMSEIYPIVAERPSPEVSQALFELLQEALVHNWRHFFPGGVMAALEGRQEEVRHQDQFGRVMQAYGQSFLQPDINLFRQNLEGLEALNRKWRLYHKAVFRSGMLPQFVHVLLRCLAARSHDLLRDEVYVALHNMASVDFDQFRTTLLPGFLGSCEGLDPNQRQSLAQGFKRDRDLPSFTQSVDNFVNDLRYYHLCNSAATEGSVRL